MKEIKLTQGKVVLVDDEDFEYLNQWKWKFIPTGNNGEGYAGGRINGDMRLMHQLLLKAPKGKNIDHINRNRFDNRKNNLRVCTSSENSQNRSKRNDNSSGYIGVVRARKRWMAQIEYRGINHYLGVFESKEEAAQVRDLKAIELFGEFAVLNFPKS